MPAASNILPFDRSLAAGQNPVADRSRPQRDKETDGPSFADSLEDTRRKDREHAARTDEKHASDRAEKARSEDAPRESDETRAHADDNRDPAGDEPKSGERHASDRDSGDGEQKKPAKENAEADSTPVGPAQAAGNAKAAAAAGQAQAHAQAQTQNQAGQAGGNQAAQAGQMAQPNASAQANAAAQAAAAAGAADGGAADSGDAAEAEPDPRMVLKPLNANTAAKKIRSTAAHVAQNGLANAASAASASQNLQALQTGTTNTGGNGGAAGASHSTIIQVMDNQLARGFSFSDMNNGQQQQQRQPDTPVQTAVQQQQPAQPTVQTAHTAQQPGFQAHLQPHMAQNAMAAAHQLSISIARGAREGADKIDIQLHPAELGRVEVKLEVGHDGRIQAVVSADRPDTLDHLRRDVNQLQKALADAGFSTDDNSFTFQDGREGAGQGQGGGNGTPGELADIQPDPRGPAPDTVLTSTGRHGVTLDGLGVDLSV